MNGKSTKPIEFDGYTVELRPESKGDYWLAFLIDLPGASAAAATSVEALAGLKSAYGAVKEAMIAANQPMPEPVLLKDFSGQFNVRLDKSLHRELALGARRQGVSLNAYVGRALALATDEPVAFTNPSPLKQER